MPRTLASSELDADCKLLVAVSPVNPPRYDCVVMRAAIEKIAGFVGWYSVARGEARPAEGRFCSQNAVTRSSATWSSRMG